MYQLKYPDTVFDCGGTLYIFGGCAGGLVIIVVISYVAYKQFSSWRSQKLTFKPNHTSRKTGYRRMLHPQERYMRSEEFTGQVSTNL